jgi:hypothetical protein
MIREILVWVGVIDRKAGEVRAKEWLAMPKWEGA